MISGVALAPILHFGAPYAKRCSVVLVSSVRHAVTEVMVITLSSGFKHPPTVLLVVAAGVRISPLRRLLLFLMVVQLKVMAVQ
jgi:hypothetical protein